MNTTILDILTDVTLREPNALEAAMASTASAGIPWLTGDQ